MKGQKHKRGFLPLSGLDFGFIEPLLRKKTGLNMRLVRNWAEIVGAAVAARAVPLKIIWPRSRRQNSAAGAAKPAAYQPIIAGGQPAAILVIGSSGGAALRLQHETGELIARINRFFGYPAIGKIRIEQHEAAAETPAGRPANAAAEPVVPPARAGEIAAIHDAALRASLLRLGRAVHAEQESGARYGGK